MTIEELKALKARIMLESEHKQQMRRENQKFFMPSLYYLYGVTKRDLFKREFEKERRKLK